MRPVSQLRIPLMATGVPVPARRGSRLRNRRQPSQPVWNVVYKKDAP